MTYKKRKLFIGCSTEALEVAKCVSEIIKEKFGNSIQPKTWKQTPWKNLGTAFSSINENIDDYYYAIFIGFPDNELNERSTTYLGTRDNTLFEFGLFLSRLGSDRTFFLKPDHPRFKVLTDFGDASLVHKYKVKKQGGRWRFVSFNHGQLIKHIGSEEQRLIELCREGPRNPLGNLVDEIKSEIRSEPNRTNEYYINTLRNSLGPVLYAKRAVTKIGIQELVIDTLDAINAVKDFCTPGQLATKQSYLLGILSVWVFAAEPLEFEPTAQNPDLRLVRNTVLNNLRHGVKYTYFVDNKFNPERIKTVLGTSSKKILDNLSIVKLDTKYFKTFFTVHFKNAQSRAQDIDSVYMSSLLAHRKDLLIQISEPTHIKRIYNRLTILKGNRDTSFGFQTYNFIVND